MNGTHERIQPPVSTHPTRFCNSGKQPLIANCRRRELVMDLTVAMVFGTVCELLRNTEFTATIRWQTPLDTRLDIHWSISN